MGKIFHFEEPKFLSCDMLDIDVFTAVALITLSLTSEIQEIKLASVNIMRNPCLTFQPDFQI